MTKTDEKTPTSAAEAVKQPVEALRGTVAQSGAIAPRPQRHYRTKLFLGYTAVAVVVFVVLAFLAKTTAYFTFDVTITRAVQTFHVAWFSALMLFLTWLGFAPQAWIISVAVIVFLYASGLKWEAVVCALSLILSSALGLGIKVLIDRPRPSPDLVNVLSQLHDYSFPSGHVLYFTTFYGFLLFLAYTLLKLSWWRGLLIIFLFGLVALIGLSRIYEGQHWASDVLAAYLLGTVWLGLSIIFYRWGKTRFFVDQPVAKERPAPKH